MCRLSVLMIVALALAACQAPPTAPVLRPPESTAAAPTAGALRTLRLPMGFIPSVQYANFYVAAEKGYFATEGLAIEFDYSFETNGVQLVGAGELPLAVVSGEQVLLARAQGLPVIYVMAWFQKFPVAVIAKAGSGIESPADLKGRRIGVPTLDGANFVGLQALLASAGLTLDDVRLEVLGFNQVPALSADQVEAVVVYSNNEPIRLAAQGEALTTVRVGDHVALAANGLLTNEDTIAREPELLRGFVRALLRGTQDVMADPGEAYAITKRYVEGLSDDAVEQQVLAATIEMWKADRLGWSDMEAWENMQAALLDTGLLSQAQDLNLAVTNAFVP